MNSPSLDQSPRVLRLSDMTKPHDFSRHFKEPGPILLELGAGKGEFAQRVAMERPDWNLLCVEIRSHRIRSLAKKCRKSSLQNLVILQARIEHLIPHCFFYGCIEEIYMNFPDPWIKHKQKNRRTVTSEFIRSLAELLKPGGRFHFATDIEAYAQHTLELVENSSLFENLVGPGELTSNPGKHQQTLFYQHALRAGRIPLFLHFQKNSEE